MLIAFTREWRSALGFVWSTCTAHASSGAPGSFDILRVFLFLFLSVPGVLRLHP
jgi:hypothetical protein